MAFRPLQLLLFASMGAISACISACNSITHMAPVTTSVASAASATVSSSASAAATATATLIASSAPAIAGRSPHPGSGEPGQCRLPALPPKPPQVSPPPQQPESRPSLVCGDATVNMVTEMAPGVHLAAASGAASAAQPAASASAKKMGYPYLGDAIHLGKFAAGAMAVLALLLLGGGLFFGGLGAESRHSISFDGNAGGFGGRAWGWRASPALVMLAASAVALVLAIAVVMRLLEVGQTPVEVTEPAASASQSAAAPSAAARLGQP